jgi:hypothetical protein
MHWSDAVNRTLANIVKIDTPTGHGTGFLCFYNEGKTICAIATAGHVVHHADKWMEPIRVYNHDCSQSILLTAKERQVTMGNMSDSALILFTKDRGELFQEDPIPLLNEEFALRVGTEVGWLGFPTLEPDTPCFFSGNISARQDHKNAYLIDGVAINGVSGGPVLYIDDEDVLKIVGTVSAYRMNRTTGETLPGLLIAQDLSLFHGVMTRVRSVDEEIKKKNGSIDRS